MSKINLQHGTTINSGEQEDEKVKTDMLRSIGKQSGESVHVVSPEEEKVGYGGKDFQKRKVLSLEWKSEGVGLIGDESGESMEVMEEVLGRRLVARTYKLTTAT